MGLTFLGRDDDDDNDDHAVDVPVAVPRSLVDRRARLDNVPFSKRLEILSGEVISRRPCASVGTTPRLVERSAAAAAAAAVRRVLPFVWVW
jgi:hypothetical protein